MKRILAWGCRLALVLSLIGLLPLPTARAASLGQRAVLPNGLVLLTSEQHIVPIVTVSVLVRAGSIQDPPDRAGVANFVAEMLEQGTTARSAPEISEVLAFVGADLTVEAGQEVSTLSLTVPSRNLDVGLDVLADMLLHPAFAPADIERKRQEVIAGIRRKAEDPPTVAADALQELIYGAHPYGHPVEGSESAVAAIARDDLVRFHTAYYRPNNVILAVVGDVAMPTLQASLERRLGAWMPGGPPIAPPAAAAPSTRPALRTIQREVTQASIALGHLAIARDDPDYYAVQAMNYLLGGGFTSYLVTSIRVEKGLAYDVGSSVGAGKYTGQFTIQLQTRNESAQEAIRAVLAAMRRMRDAPVSAQELEDAKAYLTGSFPLRLDTGAKLATMLGTIEYHGLGLDYVERYPAVIGVLTPADIQRVARQYLHPDRCAIAVVADLSKAKIQP